MNSDDRAAGQARRLCSHLVSISFPGTSEEAETAILEEIDSLGAVVATERPYAPGARLSISASGFEAPALVAQSARRETDYAVTLEFADGFRWDPRRWRPDHLYRPPRARKAKGATP